MIPIQIKNKMEAIFINSKPSRASDLHRLIFCISDKINLKASDKYVASTTQVYREYIKCQKETIDLKFQLIHGMKNFNYMKDTIPCQILKVIFSTSPKSMKRC